MTHSSPDPVAAKAQTGTIPPTQIRHPGRAIARTVFAVVVAVATLLPYVAAGVPANVPVISGLLTQAVAIAGAITRVLALPAVEQFLRQWAPWLSAEPPPVPAPVKE